MSPPQQVTPHTRHTPCSITNIATTSSLNTRPKSFALNHRLSTHLRQINRLHGQRPQSLAPRDGLILPRGHTTRPGLRPNAVLHIHGDPQPSKTQLIAVETYKLISFCIHTLAEPLRTRTSSAVCSSTTISFAEVLDAEEEERMSFLDLDGRGGGGSNDMSASLMGGAEEEEVTISKPPSTTHCSL